MVGHVAYASNLSQTFLVGGSILVPCSLLESPVIKQLTQMFTMEPGQGGWYQSVFSSNKKSVVCCFQGLRYWVQNNSSKSNLRQKKKMNSRCLGDFPSNII